jgi:putative endonuclease
VWRSWLAHHAKREDPLKRRSNSHKKYRGVAQLASALAWGARGRLFESDHPDIRSGADVLPLFKPLSMYITYILYSGKINKFYTGQTDNIYRRLEEHNRGKTPGMVKGMPWKIMYLKEFQSRKEAHHAGREGRLFESDHQDNKRIHL